MAFNIFLSHSSNDVQAATAISQYLKRIPNIAIFLAEENVVAGNLADGITSEIKVCDIFMVLYSKNSHNSQYVQNEIGVAKGDNKVMLILALDDTKPTAMLQGITYYPLYNPTVPNLPKIYEYIEQKSKEKANGELLIVGGALLGLMYVLFKK